MILSVVSAFASSLNCPMLFANTFRAFRYRDYAIFWAGLLLGHTGTLIQATAQSWLIFQLNNSPFYLGLEGFCLGLPRVLFSAFGGAVVDRTDRKLIFVITQLGFLLMALFLGVMKYLDAIRVWHLLVVSGLTGFLVSFEPPVRQSILHDVVPQSDLPNAVTLYQMVFNGSMLLGPSIGGILIPIIDTVDCFFVATAGNLVVLITIFLLRIPQRSRPATPKTLTHDVLDGLRLASHTPIFLALFTVLAVVTFCTKPYTQFMPVFARDILQVGAPGLGLLLMAPGAGAILGGLTLASVRRFPRPQNMLFFLPPDSEPPSSCSRSRAISLLRCYFCFSPELSKRLFYPLPRCCFSSTRMNPTAAESCRCSA